MIVSFRNRALKRFWEKNDPRGLNPQHLRKIELILDMLEDATAPEGMNLERLDFHKLSGENPPRWSVHVNGNWRITFSFEGEDATAVDYEDYQLIAMNQSRRSLRNPDRPPSHPGAILREIVLEGDRPTKTEFAAALGISRQMLHGILIEKHPVTVEMAVKLGHVLGNGPDIWLRMQQAHDLWHAKRKVDTSKLPVLNPNAKAA